MHLQDVAKMKKIKEEIKAHEVKSLGNDFWKMAIKHKNRLGS